MHVPYKGAGPALNDVVGGQVDFYFPGFPSAVPLSQGGKVEAARGVVRQACAGRARTFRRSPKSPASRISIFTLWVGFFGPHGMPHGRGAASSMPTINKVLLDPEIKQRLEHDGAQVSALTIPQFTDFVQREIDKYQGIIKAADIKSE